VRSASVLQADTISSAARCDVQQGKGSLRESTATSPGQLVHLLDEYSRCSGDGLFMSSQLRLE